MTGRGGRALSAAILLGVVLPPSISWSQVPVAPGAVSDVSVILQSTGGSPLEGALVALLDGRDSVVSEGLTTEGGRRMLRAPPGTYRVRARRIGFLPFMSHPVVLPRQAELMLVVETPSVVLNTILVTAKSECKRSDHASQSLGVVWDEIDKALRASQLTTEDLAGFGRGRLYRKELASNGAVLSSDTTLFSITNGRPFGTIEPDALAREGYVLGDEIFGWQYFGPDETVLRSEPFARTHCFRLVRQAARPGEIGVAFEPVPHRTTPDIQGVLWVDERTSELREMFFNFVNAGPVSKFRGGGFTRFLRLPSGAWVVSDWWLRAPRVALRPAAPYSPRNFSLTGYVENGGGILPATRQPRKVVDSLNTKR